MSKVEEEAKKKKMIICREIIGKTIMVDFTEDIKDVRKEMIN
jgi:hypothetical protein